MGRDEVLETLGDPKAGGSTLDSDGNERLTFSYAPDSRTLGIVVRAWMVEGRLVRWERSVE